VTPELYPRFSEAEFARRYGAARDLMDARHLDMLVVYGNSGISRHNHADVHYLSGFLGNRNNYLVVPRDGEPVLFVQSYNHVPNAREAAAVRVEWGGRDSGSRVARHIRDVAPRGGNLGYVGEVPVQNWLTWQQELPAWRFADVSSPFRDLRLVKSPEEIEWLQRGAALTDLAIEHLVANVRPGMHEYELAGLVEAAGMAAGGLPHLCYLSSGPQEGAGVCVPRQNLSNRVIEAGDVINFEISVSFWGYSGQAQRAIFVGREPSPLYRDLWDCALTAYNRCVDVLRPGATSEEILDAADVIAERGYTINDAFLHGFAIGLLPPSIGTRQSGRGVPKPPFVLEQGMAVVVQPNVVTPDERSGVQLGDLYVITAAGAECLHRLPPQYYVV